MLTTRVSVVIVLVGFSSTSTSTSTITKMNGEGLHLCMQLINCPLKEQLSKIFISITSRVFCEKQYGESLDSALKRDGLSLIRLLNNIGLVQETMLNLAGLMIFGRRPQRHRPVFMVKAVSFIGNNPAGDKYRDSEDIEGCLRDLYKQTMSFLTRNLRHVQGEKGFNTVGDLEVPLAALEELVVNML